MREPLGYLLTLTAYGTWLRGDARGWVDKRRAVPGMPFEPPEPARVEHNRRRLKETPVLFRRDDRGGIEAAVRETCCCRNWYLHEVNARSNQVHAVVAAPDVSPDRVLADLKAYGTRALNRMHPEVRRKNWWTEGGSKRFLNDEMSLCAAIEYVRNQDRHHGREV